MNLIILTSAFLFIIYNAGFGAVILTALLGFVVTLFIFPSENTIRSKVGGKPFGAFSAMIPLISAPLYQTSIVTTACYIYAISVSKKYEYLNPDSPGVLSWIFALTLSFSFIWLTITVCFLNPHRLRDKKELVNNADFNYIVFPSLIADIVLTAAVVGWFYFFMAK